MRTGMVLAYLAKLTCETSDQWGTRLSGLSDNPRVRNILMKEYIYLKAGISARLASMAQGSTSVMAKHMLKDNFIDALKVQEDLFKYGGNPRELLNRLNHYFEIDNGGDYFPSQSIFMAFISFLDKQIGGIESLNISMALKDEHFIENVVDYLATKTGDYQSSGAGGSGGCLSVVACISIFIVVLLCFVCI